MLYDPTVDRRPSHPADVDRGPVGFLGHLVVGFCALIPLVELGRSAVVEPYRAGLVPVAIGVLLTTPLHLYLVWFAVRGTVAPRGGAVFAALLVTSGVAAVVIGGAWAMMLVFVALGAFLVRPLRTALAVLGGCCAVVLLVGVVRADGLTASYYVFSLVFRVSALYGVIWLVAARRRLRAAQHELRDLAVVTERFRIVGSLREVVAPVLERAATVTPSALPAVVDDARDALLRARRVLGGHRARSRAHEIDTALALLTASGSPVVLHAADVDLSRPATPEFRAALRRAVVDLLARDVRHRVVLVVEPTTGDPRVTVENRAADRG